MIKKVEDYFWITNKSKKAVHLQDIGVVIYPFRSLNLLDRKHYSLTKQQLEKSKENGSLFRRKNEVVVREVPPGAPIKQYIELQKDAIIPTRQRSIVEIENIKYEELNVSDDDYAAENAENAQSDYLGKWNK